MTAHPNWGPTPEQVDALITLALREDVGTDDITSRACIDPHAEAEANILAKEPLVVAGMPFFARVFHHIDPSLTVTPWIDEGTLVEAQTIIGQVRGRARSLLIGERTALNILQRLSGTATVTRRWADAIEGTGAQVCDTRKTDPGMRYLQKYAVRMGGGANHRFGLDSGVLIKDNHIVAAGGLAEAIQRCRAHVPHGLKIEVEIEDLEAIPTALDAGADIILLDNMSSETMEAAVREIRARDPRVIIEASGGLSLDRAREVALTGVDLLSVGALTHSARAVDISLNF